MTSTRTHVFSDKEKTLSPKNDAAQGGAVFSASVRNGEFLFVFSGTLAVHSLHTVEEPLHKAVQVASASVLIDIDGLEHLDTSGALLINETVSALRKKGVSCSLRNSNPLFRTLLETAVIAEDARPGHEVHSPFIVWLNSIGRCVCEQLDITGELIGFFGKFLITSKGIIRNPQRMRWTSLIFHMEQVGFKAVPIVALLTFLIGMVVAYMGAEQLQRFGAQIFAVNLLEVTVLREMAVLITSIVVAGRSSSSFTAQIGAMVANEEVAAIRSMGLDPDVLLVVPRVAALILCLPMLVFIADIMALLGGSVAIWYSIGLGFSSFLQELQSVANINNFIVGMVKTPFFALSIGLVGCFQGFRATTSAESVGLLTTVSVVQAIFIVILLDAVFAIFFTTLGI